MIVIQCLQGHVGAGSSKNCLSNTASFALCVFRRVGDRRNLPHYSQLLKNNCVRQVALDEWFPLSTVRSTQQAQRAQRQLASRNGSSRGRAQRWQSWAVNS